MTTALSDIKVEVTDVQPCVKKIRVEVPAARVSEAAEGKWRELAKSAKVQGFRPGKAPRAVLEKMYGDYVLGEVGEHLIHETYETVVKDNGLEVFGNPSFEEVKVAKGEPLVYNAVVELFPKIEIPAFDGWAFTREIRTVEGKEIESAINSLRETNAELVPVENRGVVDGDHVFMDYTAFVDGKEEPKLSGKGQQMIVNSVEETLFVAFHRAIVGMKAGEEKDFSMPLPKTYPDPAISGKDAAFKVKVTAVKEKKLPEVTDEMVTASTPYTSIEEMRKDLQTRAEEREKQKAEEGLRRAILKKFRESASFPLPPKMVAHYGEMYADRMTRQMREWGMDIQSQPDFDREKFVASSKEKGEEWARDEVIIENIAKANGLQPDEAELERLQTEYAEYLKSEDRNTRYNAALFTVKEALQESVFKFVLGRIAVTDKAVEAAHAKEAE